MVRSIDPRHETFRLIHWPLTVAAMFGTRVAETILASVQVRARQQAGHMDASDLIRALPEHPCEKGAVHTWIKEGKGAIKWTRLSCRTFAANAVRLQLHALAYNLGNFMRTLAMPKAAEPWSLTSLREKLIKIGAKVVSHGRYVTFQLAEVAVSRQMFQEILSLIARLRGPPAPA
jgi:Transposase DDE domain group 1